MTKKIYLAPMEGVTDSIFRESFSKTYGGVDKYFTPFLSPNETMKFTTRELREIDPARNNIDNTVPQLLTNKAGHFVWACEQIASLGYKEINFNLGCPSGTVVAKKKGSGMLFYPEELDNLLYEIFDGIEKKKLGLDISIKTRLGRLEPDEFYEVLDIYNKYPIKELTVHPRIQKDFYREPVRMEYFDYAYKHAKAALVYNGELWSHGDVDKLVEKYPNISAVMLGRGIVGTPWFFSGDFDRAKFKAFHDELLGNYINEFSGDKPVLHRMKEFWAFWEKNFPGNDKAIKKIRKANKVVDYKAATRELL